MLENHISDGTSLDDDVEVTPEMIEAGKDALCRNITGWDYAPSSDQDKAIATAFKAMLAVHRLSVRRRSS